MRQNDFRSAAPVWAALSPLVLWLAAIAAYAYEDGMNLFQWMGRFSQVLERPFSIGWTPYTLKCMLGSLLLYGCGVALYYSSRENRRPGEEYGSAKWGNPKELNRKYMDHRHKDANIILTQRVRLGMDGYITQRNMNVLVVGGSGSCKTRFFCKPNIYSANCSYLITDPKGELLRAAGALLAAQGYEVRVFNLIDPSQSDGYNPFSYIHSEKDVLTLIDNLIKNTTPRNASSNDPFWEKAEIALDSALMLYLVSEAPPEEQNFEMLIYMMNFAEVREEDDQYRSPLDMLFRALEEEQPNHVAVKQYKAFKQAAGVVCSKRLLNQAVGKSLRTHNLKPKKGAQVMRKNEKITALYERLSRDDFGKDDDQQRESNSISNQKANALVLGKAAESNNLIQEKYITVSAEKKSVEEARAFFSRVGTDLTTGLSRMSSSVREITVNDRLRLLHDFYRPGEEQLFRFNLEDTIRKGHDFRDCIAPDCISFQKNHYELGDHVGRTLFLREYASFISDEMITELMDYPRNMMLSIDIIPVAMDEAVSISRKQIMAVDSDITRCRQRQNQNGNYDANIPYELELARSETKEFMDDLMSRDQRMMLALVTLTHLADNLEQLDQDTEALQAIGRARGCQFNILRYQQEDALNTVLPLGLKRIDATRTLTTECTAVLMPFKSQEIQDAGGIYYGVNAVSHNLIVCNRGNLLNGNGFITGVSGSGKSMAAKQEVSALALSTDHDIIIVDPEREYGELVRALGGEVITISASDPNGCHINALDLYEGYGDGKEPLVMKSEFIMSLYEQLMGADKIEPQEKSIIDRSVGNIYREYLKNYQGQPPTLKDLYDDLMKQVNPEAHRIALALELFTVGSLNVFSHQTNINTKSRILCFDIQDLGENLKSVGLLVMLDAIYNRVIQNRREGKYTHVYIDEIYLFFANGSGSGHSITNYSSEFLYKCWKRFRKYGATLTGITQNVEECLLSNTARMMFANSEFLLMLNQATTDREQLARLLGASDTQMSYVDNALAGHGLIKVGGAIVPFANELPKNTELYRLMTTKPGED